MKKKVAKSRASPENSDSDTENTPCLYWEGLPPPPLPLFVLGRPFFGLE